jgi:hypothetical protein
MDCRNCPKLLSCRIVQSAESYAKARDRRQTIAAELQKQLDERKPEK